MKLVVADRGSRIIEIEASSRDSQHFPLEMCIHGEAGLISCVLVAAGGREELAAGVSPELWTLQMFKVVLEAQTAQPASQDALMARRCAVRSFGGRL
jgi:hypothetical protein